MLDDFLTALLAAKDDAEKAAIVAESAFEELHPITATVARHCVILNWFDEAVVAALCVDLLEIAEDGHQQSGELESSRKGSQNPSNTETLPDPFLEDGSTAKPLTPTIIYIQLATLPFIETLQNRLTYHELTREGLLRRYSEESTELLRTGARLALPAYQTKADDLNYEMQQLFCLMVVGDQEEASTCFDKLLEEQMGQERWQTVLNLFSLRVQVDSIVFIDTLAYTDIHYFSRGFAHHELGNLARAIFDYNLAIELNPDYIFVYNRGNAYKAQGKLEQAISDYDLAIAANPNDAMIYNHRGIIRYIQGEIYGAITDYNDAIQLNPNYAKAYYNRGIAYHIQGNLYKAILDYNRAIELNPEFAMAYNNRGNARYALGIINGAIVDYNHSIQINPTDATAYYNRGNAYKIKEDLGKAITDYNRTIQLNPNDAEAYYNRSIALINKGDSNSAIADYNRAIQLDSNIARINALDTEILFML